MIIWVDAQLSPTLASWIHVTFGVEARALRDLGLRDSTVKISLRSVRHRDSRKASDLNFGNRCLLAHLQ